MITTAAFILFSTDKSCIKKRNHEDIFSSSGVHLFMYIN